MASVLIYNRVLLDMATGRVLEADCFEYSGEIALCKGGSSTTVTSNEVDKEYNARLAAIQERAQDLSDEYFQFWKENNAVLEAAKIQKELTNVDQQDEITKQELTLQQWQLDQQLEQLAQQGLISQQQLDLLQAQNKQALDTQAVKNQLENMGLELTQGQLAQQLEQLAQQGVISQQQLDILQAQNQQTLDTQALKNELEKMGLDLSKLQAQQALDTQGQKNIIEGLGLNLSQKQAENALGNIDQENRIYQGILGMQEDTMGTTGELAQSYLKESLDGVNGEDWANRAGTDQQIAASNANSQLARNASRLGLNLNSGAFQSAMADQSTKNAANVATARTKAYREADKESYNRLGQGLNAGLGLLSK